MPYELDGNFSDFRRDLPAAKAYMPYPTDTCTMGYKSKKSLLWVYGNFVQYHMRLNPALIPALAEKIDSIFPYNDRLRNKNYFIEGHPLDYIEGVSNSANLERDTTRLKHKRKQNKRKRNRRRKLNESQSKKHTEDGMECVSAAFHVRNGKPGSDGSHRTALQGKEHIIELNKYSEHLKLSNKKVCDVYVAALYLDDTIFMDPEEMKSIPYNIKMLNRTELPDENTEVEALLPQLKKDGFPVHEIFTDYFVDLMLMGIADIFIGSHSNAFTLVAALRRVWHSNAPMNYTSFIDSHYSPPVLVPLEHSIDYWQSWPRGEGGFIGGVEI